MPSKPRINRMVSRFLTVLLLASGVPRGRAAAAPPPVDLVVVYKSRKVMQLLTGDQVTRSYQIALGRNPLGHKQQAGDCRTPEGCYLVDSHRGASRFHKALHLSYPNSRDLATAKKRGVSPGGEIMIHGLPKGYEDLAEVHSRRNWTKGCIAVSNDEIDEIWRLVADGTRIIIKP